MQGGNGYEGEDITPMPPPDFNTYPTVRLHRPDTWLNLWRQRVSRRRAAEVGLTAAVAGVIGLIAGEADGRNHEKQAVGVELPTVTGNWIGSRVENNQLTTHIHVALQLNGKAPDDWFPFVTLTTPREHAPAIQRDLKNPIDGSWAILGFGIPDEEGNCTITADLAAAGTPKGSMPLSFDVWSRHIQGEGKGGIFPTEQPDGILTVSYT